LWKIFEEIFVEEIKKKFSGKDFENKLWKKLRTNFVENILKNCFGKN
jgi:hypothetical protein